MILCKIKTIYNLNMEGFLKRYLTDNWISAYNLKIYWLIVVSTFLFD